MDTSPLLRERNKVKKKKAYMKMQDDLANRVRLKLQEQQCKKDVFF